MVDLLAKHKPGHIDSLFQVRQLNSQGIYCIRFNVNGKDEDVVVDDHIPCYTTASNETRPAFATSANYGELWPILLEKAWAKLHGAYCMMKKGSPTIALSILYPEGQLQQYLHDDISQETLIKEV